MFYLIPHPQSLSFEGEGGYKDFIIL